MMEKIMPWKHYVAGDYEDFWKNRQYENNSDFTAIKKLLPIKEKIIDLGANYGRLAPIYKDFSIKVLVDGSHSSLLEAISRKDAGILFAVVADIRKLPFCDDEFDVVLCIRTIHHNNKASLIFSEANRVASVNATFILEYANKRNIKQIVMAQLRISKRNPFSYEPTRLGDEIYNFHPLYVENLMESNEFRIADELGASFLRSKILKRVFSVKKLLAMEERLSELATRWKLAPSIYLKAIKQ